MGEVRVEQSVRQSNINRHLEDQQLAILQAVVTAARTLRQVVPDGVDIKIEVCALRGGIAIRSQPGLSDWLLEAIQRGD